MRFQSTAARTSTGHWKLQHTSPDVGEVTVTAPTREEALEKLKGEIRYRLELCPCTGESYQHIDVDVTDAPG